MENYLDIVYITNIRRHYEMNTQLLKRTQILIGAFSLILLMACPGTEPEPKPEPAETQDFSSAPALNLVADNGSIGYTWTVSNPPADSYVLYWKKGDFSDASDVKDGTAVTGAVSGKQISGLTNEEIYSFVLTAKKAGYHDIDSMVRQEMPSALPVFSTAPLLFIESADNSLVCTWSPSQPEADSYDIYWIKGSASDSAALKAGTLISNVVPEGAIVGLTNKEEYSVMVTANKEGYRQSNSACIQARPTPSSKRGISQNTNSATTETDFELLKPGLSWWYSWGMSPGGSWFTVSKDRDILFSPMAWRWLDDGAEDTIRRLKAENPGLEYIMACNEPNLTDQANLTPAQYVENPNGWPRLVKIAKELNLKIISPAMNYGTLSGYGNPTVWLDEFFAHPDVDINDVHAISVHSYMDYPSAMKGYVTSTFAKYDKPMWLTEFCAWENQSGGGGGMQGPNIGNNQWRWQAWLMSNLCILMEMEPKVERYSWFIGKSSQGTNGNPYNKLLVGLNDEETELTDLGKVYVYMGSCDQRVWAYPGQQIAAKDFTQSNLISNVGASGLNDSVKFRPTTDTEDGAAILDIHDFRNVNSMWVEYQVIVPAAGTYELTLRYQTTQSTTMQISVDGDTAQSSTLNSSSWDTTSIDLGTLAAGKHTLRLRASAGNCALNWLKVE